jgi:hypothetical protein
MGFRGQLSARRGFELGERSEGSEDVQAALAHLAALLHDLKPLDYSVRGKNRGERIEIDHTGAVFAIYI